MSTRLLMGIIKPTNPYCVMPIKPLASVTIAKINKGMIGTPNKSATRLNAL
ncbi:hypothetical protein [Vibrio parahaemolyticus]|uniref:hypothetical protein n=1 Tax=Vibrio parahaemolyticus TaxID=670 RepID=UPI0015DD766E|nr:hypothetical protein [Vibrio parahaemolyticus]